MDEEPGAGVAFCEKAAILLRLVMLPKAAGEVVGVANVELAARLVPQNVDPEDPRLRLPVARLAWVRRRPHGHQL
jgi:hypothetical protein